MLLSQQREPWNTSTSVEKIKVESIRVKDEVDAMTKESKVVKKIAP